LFLTETFITLNRVHDARAYGKKLLSLTFVTVVITLTEKTLPKLILTVWGQVMEFT
jgi:hypothetical protein